MKKYYTYTVKKLITVQQLVTIEYLQVEKDFFYPEESHDFYEFVCVEKGSIICKTENEEVFLQKKDFFLIPTLTAQKTQTLPPLLQSFALKANQIQFQLLTE